MEVEPLNYKHSGDYFIFSRDGLDIRFSIRYPAKSGHFSAFRYPALYQILKTRYPVSEYLVSVFQNGRISSRPDIWQNCSPVHPY